MPSVTRDTRHFLAAVLALLAALCLQSAGASSLLSDGGPSPMTVDILPGNPENTVNLGKQRRIPVAIFGSAGLDVNDVNPRTLSLEAVSITLVGKSDKSWCYQQDLNEDGWMDLVCDIKVIGYRVEPGDIEVVISADTYQRQSLQARGILRFRVE